MKTAMLFLAAAAIAGAYVTPAAAYMMGADCGICMPGTCTPSGGNKAKNVAKMCRASNCKHTGQTSHSAKRKRSKKR